MNGLILKSGDSNGRESARAYGPNHDKFAEAYIDSWSIETRAYKTACWEIVHGSPEAMAIDDVYYYAWSNQDPLPYMKDI